MKKILLTASAIALIPASASAQLLGGGLGGGIGGTLGGTLDSTIGAPLGSTIERTTKTVRGTVDGTASTDGDQSVNAREGRVSASRSANGSITGSTASLASLPVPALGSMVNGSASGNANAQGNADAQLIGTDAVTGAVAPIAGQAQNIAASATARATSTATAAANTAVSSVPTPGLPALPALPAMGSANASGSAEGNGSASLMSSPLAVAGSAASAAQGAANVAPGMPVMTPDGASLGQVTGIVADGRGQVEQVVVSQGNVTRTLPAGMFSATGNALVAGEAQGAASAANSAERVQPEGGEAN